LRLYEYEAKGIFQKFGIPIPKAKLAKNLIQVQEIAAELGISLLLKAQILTGSRGKIGGIQIRIYRSCL
jgi:succinyl-CoA synthetase beta subunit